MALKTTIIGGGSAYTPGLITAFIKNASAFPGMQLALMDVAEKELGIIHRLGERLIQTANVDLSITATTNQQEAVSDADFILTSFRQGGFEARHQDESIPLKYNIIGQETIGPGGFFFAMRTLPVIKSLIENIKQSAPSAVLVNYTNPTQIVAEAVTHFCDLPCISICDQTKDDKTKILQALNMPDASVELESVGLNHATWSTKFTINGEDGVKVMGKHTEDVLARNDISERVKRQFVLTREFGRLPNSYMQYYYFREETVTESKRAPKTRAQIILESLPGYYQHFMDQITAEIPHLTSVRGGSIFGDMAVDVIRDLATKTPSIHTLNVPNRFALADFAPDRIVEVPARLEKRSATPLVQPQFPSEISGLLKMLAEYQWAAAKSIWNNDWEAMRHALAANPLVLSLSLAKQLLNDIFPLQRQYLFKNTS